MIFQQNKIKIFEKGGCDKNFTTDLTETSSRILANPIQVSWILFSNKSAAHTYFFFLTFFNSSNSKQVCV